MQQKKERIGAVILAAGMSKRMGRPKLLLPLNGKPIFLHAVDVALAAGLEPIILVVGEHEQKMRNLLANRPEINIVKNDNYQSGMSSSLKKGIQYVARPEVVAAMVMLADQPFVPTEVLKQLKLMYWNEREKGYLIYRPMYQGQAGHPILFDKSLFPEFEHLVGDRGGKSILSRHMERLKYIPFHNATWQLDIDTPIDYEKYTK